MKALADGIADDAKKKADLIAWGKEGTASDGWLLMDYGDLMVHLFSPEMRDYYRLEELWASAHVVLRLQ